MSLSGGETFKHWKSAMRDGFTRMGDASGRSSPRNFWLFITTIILIYLGLFIVDTRVFEQLQTSQYRSNLNLWGEFKAHLFSNLFRLIVALPVLSAIARRLHDTSRSTWLLRFWVIAWLGSLLIIQGVSSVLNLGFAAAHSILTLWLFIVLMIPSEAAPNQFGPPDNPFDGTLFD